MRGERTTPHILMSQLPQDPPQAWLLAALARYERPLVRYALSLCGDLEQARDAVQDTFIKLSREPQPPGRGAVSPEALEALAPWLFTVCKNRVIDLHRKHSRLVPMDTTTLEQPTADAEAPDAVLREKETAQQLRALIRALPEKQQQLIQLKFQAGLSYREIAATTGLNPGTIGWLIHQAVQTLREQWARLNA